MPRTLQLGRASSDVYQGNGCRHALVARLSQETARLVVISDSHVEAALRPLLFREAEWLTVPAGESSKSLEVAAQLWARLLHLGADRGTAIVAVGGGMVGDLAGFVAATYLRGLPFYLLPTSLLAMVDASVGGKVGIDLPEGKNLVGQFYPASAVAIDPELLDSLPAPEWASGMAEVIKHGVLQGDPLWKSLLDLTPQEAGRSDARERLLQDAVEVKLRVVTEDPYERTGLRATLNLGHTFGHAFEWCSGYKLRHGEAVGLGTIAAVRLSRLLGTLEQDFESELLLLLERWGLPTSLPTSMAGTWGWESLCQAFDRDKKSSAGSWNFIVPRALGQVYTVRAPESDKVREAVESLRSPAGRVVS